MLNKDIMRLPMQQISLQRNRKSNPKIIAKIHVNASWLMAPGLGCCPELTRNLVNFVQELVFDLVKGIVLGNRFGGVFSGD